MMKRSNQGRETEEEEKKKERWEDLAEKGRLGRREKKETKEIKTRNETACVKRCWQSAEKGFGMLETGGEGKRS